MSTSSSAPTAPSANGRLRTLGLGLAGVLGTTAVLELAVRAGLLPAAWFPPPAEIVPAFAPLVTTGELFTPVGQTLQGWGLGILAAPVVAVPLGVLIGSTELAHRM